MDLVPETADPGFASVANPAFPSPVVHQVPLDRGPAIARADLAPYFADGKVAEAKKAYDHNQFNAARALLEGAQDTPPVRFLRALAAFRAQDFAFASRELESLADGYPALRDRCLVFSGWSYEGLKDWESAARVFGAVSPGSRMYPDACTGLARARKLLKDPKGAVEALGELVDRPAPPWGRDVGAEALSTLAELHAWRGDRKAERAALLRLWSMHPLSPQARRAELRLGDLAGAPTEVLVTRADALIEAHRNVQGVAILEPLLEGLKLPEPLACRAHFAMGKGQRKLRRHARAIQVLGPVVAKCKDPDLRARALYTLGFSQSFIAPAQAARTYELLARDYPAHTFADDALFFAAESHLHAAELDQAAERLIELVDRYPLGEYAADGLFKLFWISREQGQSADALVFLEEIEGRTRTAADSYETERARYWRARVLEEREQREDALRLYTSVAREHPAGYYGLIARERVEQLDAAAGEQLLKEVAASVEKKDPFPIHAGALANDPQFVSAVELTRLGFGDQVPTEVLAVDRTNLPDDGVRLLVLLLSLAGEERSAHGLARLWLRGELSGRITAENRALWEIAYPQAFRDIVVKHSQSSRSLDPDLLQALMREESALDPKALSWAGALGLCQLMPTTAAEVALHLRLKSPSQASLLEPDLNIRLGASYLGDLVTHQKGVTQYALASYNAGEGSVARWRADNPVSSLDSWVELIPVQETRGYVKRVLRSYNTYKLLYAPTQPARTVAPVGRPASAAPKSG